MIADFVAAYLAILVVPGPNLFAISSIAALQGFRAALPFCAGASLGAGGLCAAMAGVADAAAVPGADSAMRLMAAVLLGCTAVSVARKKAPASAGDAPSHGSARTATTFGSGLLTAATNPVTATFFAAQFLGPLQPARGTANDMVAVACVAGTALAFFLYAASLMARPVVHRAALAWYRPIRLAAAALLLAMAVNMARTSLAALTAGSITVLG